jgi:glycosyltransferase involved in cell wall biosynthesis
VTDFTSALVIYSPVDLGSRTLGLNVGAAVGTRFATSLFAFSPEWDSPDLSLARRYVRRAGGAIKLWRAIGKARRQGGLIVFQGMTALTYAAPLLSCADCICVTDWTRTLQLGDKRESFGSRVLRRFQAAALSRVRAVVALSSAVQVNLRQRYGVPAAKTVLAFPPVAGLPYLPAPDEGEGPPKILFVGGDLIRKGGDLLIQWLISRPEENVRLTMLTSSPVKETDPRLTVLRDVLAGSPAHWEAYLQADLLVLPTTYDAFPMALAEGGAAGLPLLSTKAALGSSTVIVEGSNGRIFEDGTSLISALTPLLQDRDALSRFRSQALLMRSRYRLEVLGDLVAEIASTSDARS